jgi:hypothetical protein
MPKAEEFWTLDTALVFCRRCVEAVHTELLNARFYRAVKPLPNAEQRYGFLGLDALWLFATQPLHVRILELEGELADPSGPIRIGGEPYTSSHLAAVGVADRLLQVVKPDCAPGPATRSLVDECGGWAIRHGPPAETWIAELDAIAAQLLADRRNRDVAKGLMDEFADVDFKMLVAQIECNTARAKVAAVPPGTPDAADEWRDAKWLYQASGKLINPQTLWIAADRMKVISRGAKRGSRRFYRIDSVCANWPEHRERITTAINRDRQQSKS